MHVHGFLRKIGLWREDDVEVHHFGFKKIVTKNVNVSLHRKMSTRVLNSKPIFEF
jgi:hypothetical protein